MSELNGKKFKLFTLSSNKELAEEIADSLGVPLSECEVQRFADGEINVSITETVRGHDIFVVQPTNNPVNENLMELLIMCDALKRASARSITLIIPYYGYSRQDRKAKSREPITAKLVADLLQTAGANRVIAVDLHAPQIQGFFNIPIDNFQGLPVLVNYLIEKQFKDVVVVSPDHGGAVRARAFAQVLNSNIAIIDKRRPKANVAEVMSIIGDVKGKTCVLVDDICDTAGTLTAGAKALMDAGAVEVYAACTHALLSGPAVERINNSPIKELIVTNTVVIPENKKSPKIVVLPIGPVLAHGIKCILDDAPLSGLFTYHFEDK